MEAIGGKEEQADLSEVWARLKEPLLSYRQFAVLRAECVGRNVDPELAQFWILRAIVRNDEVSRWYWVSDFSIEEDIMECVEAIENSPNPEGLHNSLLRHVRRFLLTRYAFCDVQRVNKILALRLSRKGGHLRHYFSVGWLWKDLLLPRIALSLFIGYAILLGAGHVTDWLRLASSSGRSGWYIFSLLLCLIVLLVYLSVRTRIGSVNEGALVRRTLGISGGCLLWAGTAAGIQDLGQLMLFHCHVWSWPAELLAAEAALFVALLGQFFFGKSGSGSISEPL